MEMPECFTEHWPVARKSHKCCECRGTIQPGEKYRRITGVWDGQGATFKQCADCAPLYDAAMKLHDNEHPPLGHLWEDEENIGEDYVATWDAIAKKRGLMTVAERDAEYERRKKERIEEYQRNKSEGRES